MSGETKVGRRATLRCQFCLTLNRVSVDRAGDRPRCGECGRPMLLDRPIKVTGEDLERVVGDAEVPVLVDVYADWCGPCKAMAPLLDDLARERAGTVLVLKLDADADPEAAVRHDIRGIPTLILFRGGVEAGRRVGAVPAAEMHDLLDGGG